MKKILITGVAGFIGSSLAKELLECGYYVIGIDNFTDYYNVKLKEDRIHKLSKYLKFRLWKIDITDKSELEKVIVKDIPDIIINLAAQPGVRCKKNRSDIYIQTNVVGFYNVLEVCKNYSICHLLYASSSSVYGKVSAKPFEENSRTDRPASLYAATKKIDEILAAAYNDMFGFTTIGFRFFSVYGPYGRPDMFYYKMLDQYFSNREILINNDQEGSRVKIYRDFTYIDDVVGGILCVIKKIEDLNNQNIVMNIGNEQPLELEDVVKITEECLSNSLAKKVNFKVFHNKALNCDVPITFSENRILKEKLGYNHHTDFREGMQRFTDWYVEYNNIL